MVKETTVRQLVRDACCDRTFFSPSFKCTVTLIGIIAWQLWSKADQAERVGERAREEERGWQRGQKKDTADAGETKQGDTGGEVEGY